MENLEVFAAALGWCTTINIGLLVIVFLFMTLARNRMTNMHSKMFGVSTEDLPKVYFTYLAYYKLAILVFDPVPYIALRIIV